MFLGKYEHLMDAKGRVSIPSSFRELVLAGGGAEVIVVRCPVSPPRVLEAYPRPAWQLIADKIRALPRFDPNVLRLESIFFGSAHPCELDGQGRVLIPPGHREWAGLVKDVVFVGAGERFRIADRAAADETLADAEAAFRADPAALARLNL